MNEYAEEYNLRLTDEITQDGVRWQVGDMRIAGKPDGGFAYAKNHTTGEEFALIPQIDEQQKILQGFDVISIPDAIPVQNLERIPEAVRAKMADVGRDMVMENELQAIIAEESPEAKTKAFAKKLEGVDVAAAELAEEHFTEEREAAVAEQNPHAAYAAEEKAGHYRIAASEAKTNPEYVAEAQKAAQQAESRAISHAQKVMQDRENGKGTGGPER